MWNNNNNFNNYQNRGNRSRRGSGGFHPRGNRGRGGPRQQDERTQLHPPLFPYTSYRTPPPLFQSNSGQNHRNDFDLRPPPLLNTHIPNHSNNNNNNNMGHNRPPPFPPNRYRPTGRFLSPPRSLPPSVPPQRPPSPLPGSDEYRQRNIQHASELIKQQLREDNNGESDGSGGGGDVCSGVGAGEVAPLQPPPMMEHFPREGGVPSVFQGHLSQTGGYEKAEKRPMKPTVVSRVKASAKQPDRPIDVHEIHQEIVRHISNLSHNKKVNIVNQVGNTAGYDVAILQIQKQKRLELSRALRDLCSSNLAIDPDSDVLNDIIPDIGIKLEDLPREVIQQLSSLNADWGGTEDLELKHGLPDNSPPFEEYMRPTSPIEDVNLTDTNPTFIHSSMVDPELCFKQAEQLISGLDAGDEEDDFLENPPMPPFGFLNELSAPFGAFGALPPLQLDNAESSNIMEDPPDLPPATIEPIEQNFEIFQNQFNSEFAEEVPDLHALSESPQSDKAGRYDKLSSEKICHEISVLTEEQLKFRPSGDDLYDPLDDCPDSPELPPLPPEDPVAVISRDLKLQQNVLADDQLPPLPSEDSITKNLSESEPQMEPTKEPTNIVNFKITKPVMLQPSALTIEAPEDLIIKRIKLKATETLQNLLTKEASTSLTTKVTEDSKPPENVLTRLTMKVTERSKPLRNISTKEPTTSLTTKVAECTKLPENASRKESSTSISTKVTERSKPPQNVSTKESSICLTSKVLERPKPPQKVSTKESSTSLSTKVLERPKPPHNVSTKESSTSLTTKVTERSKPPQNVSTKESSTSLTTKVTERSKPLQNVSTKESSTSLTTKVTERSKPPQNVSTKELQTSLPTKVTEQSKPPQNLSTKEPRISLTMKVTEQSEPLRNVSTKQSTAILTKKSTEHSKPPQNVATDSNSKNSSKLVDYKSNDASSTFSKIVKTIDSLPTKELQPIVVPRPILFPRPILVPKSPNSAVAKAVKTSELVSSNSDSHKREPVKPKENPRPKLPRRQLEEISRWVEESSRLTIPSKSKPVKLSRNNAIPVSTMEQFKLDKIDVAVDKSRKKSEEVPIETSRKKSVEVTIETSRKKSEDVETSLPKQPPRKILSTSEKISSTTEQMRKDVPSKPTMPCMKHIDRTNDEPSKTSMYCSTQNVCSNVKPLKTKSSGAEAVFDPFNVDIDVSDIPNSLTSNFDARLSPMSRRMDSAPMNRLNPFADNHLFDLQDQSSYEPVIKTQEEPVVKFRDLKTLQNTISSEAISSNDEAFDFLQFNPNNSYLPKMDHQLNYQSNSITDKSTENWNNCANCVHCREKLLNEQKRKSNPKTKGVQKIKLRRKKLAEPSTSSPTANTETHCNELVPHSKQSPELPVKKVWKSPGELKMMPEVTKIKVEKTVYEMEDEPLDYDERICETEEEKLDSPTISTQSASQVVTEETTVPIVIPPNMPIPLQVKIEDNISPKKLSKNILHEMDEFNKSMDSTTNNDILSDKSEASKNSSNVEQVQACTQISDISAKSCDTKKSVASVISTPNNPSVPILRSEPDKPCTSEHERIRISTESQLSDGLLTIGKTGVKNSHFSKRSVKSQIDAKSHSENVASKECLHLEKFASGIENEAKLVSEQDVKTVSIKDRHVAIEILVPVEKNKAKLVTDQEVETVSMKKSPVALENLVSGGENEAKIVSKKVETASTKDRHIAIEILVPGEKNLAKLVTDKNVETVSKGNDSHVAIENLVSHGKNEAKLVTEKDAKTISTKDHHIVIEKLVSDKENDAKLVTEQYVETVSTKESHVAIENLVSGAENNAELVIEQDVDNVSTKDRQVALEKIVSGGENDAKLVAEQGVKTVPTTDHYGAIENMVRVGEDHAILVTELEIGTLSTKDGDIKPASLVSCGQPNITLSTECPHVDKSYTDVGKASTIHQILDRTSTEHQDHDKSSTEYQYGDQSSTKHHDVDKSSAEHQNVNKPSTGHENADQSSTEYQNVDQSSVKHQDVDRSSTEHPQVTESAILVSGVERDAKVSMDHKDVEALSTLERNVAVCGDYNVENSPIDNNDSLSNHSTIIEQVKIVYVEEMSAVEKLVETMDNTTQITEENKFSIAYKEMDNMLSSPSEMSSVSVTVSNSPSSNNVVPLKLKDVVITNNTDIQICDNASKQVENQELPSAIIDTSNIEDFEIFNEPLYSLESTTKVPGKEINESEPVTDNEGAIHFAMDKAKNKLLDVNIVIVNEAKPVESVDLKNNPKVNTDASRSFSNSQNRSSSTTSSIKITAQSETEIKQSSNADKSSKEGGKLEKSTKPYSKDKFKSDSRSRSNSHEPHHSRKEHVSVVSDKKRSHHSKSAKDSSHKKTDSRDSSKSETRDKRSSEKSKKHASLSSTSHKREDGTKSSSRSVKSLSACVQTDELKFSNIAVQTDSKKQSQARSCQTDDKTTKSVRIQTDDIQIMSSVSHFEGSKKSVLAQMREIDKEIERLLKLKDEMYKRALVCSDESDDDKKNVGKQTKVEVKAKVVDNDNLPKQRGKRKRVVNSDEDEDQIKIRKTKPVDEFEKSHDTNKTKHVRKSTNNTPKDLSLRKTQKVLSRKIDKESNVKDTELQNDSIADDQLNSRSNVNNRKNIKVVKKTNSEQMYHDSEVKTDTEVDNQTVTRHTQDNTISEDNSSKTNVSRVMRKRKSTKDDENFETQITANDTQTSIGNEDNFSPNNVIKRMRNRKSGKDDDDVSANTFDEVIVRRPETPSIGFKKTDDVHGKRKGRQKTTKHSKELENLLLPSTSNIPSDQLQNIIPSRQRSTSTSTNASDIGSDRLQSLMDRSQRSTSANTSEMPSETPAINERKLRNRCATPANVTPGTQHIRLRSKSISETPSDKTQITDVPRNLSISDNPPEFAVESNLWLDNVNADLNLNAIDSGIIDHFEDSLNADDHSIIDADDFENLMEVAYEEPISISEDSQSETKGFKKKASRKKGRIMTEQNLEILRSSYSDTIDEVVRRFSVELEEEVGVYNREPQLPSIDAIEFRDCIVNVVRYTTEELITMRDSIIIRGSHRQEQSELQMNYLDIKAEPRSVDSHRSEHDAVADDDTYEQPPSLDDCREHVLSVAEDAILPGEEHAEETEHTEEAEQTEEAEMPHLIEFVSIVDEVKSEPVALTLSESIADTIVPTMTAVSVPEISTDVPVIPKKKNCYEGYIGSIISVKAIDSLVFGGSDRGWLYIYSQSTGDQLGQIEIGTKAMTSLCIVRNQAFARSHGAGAIGEPEHRLYTGSLDNTIAVIDYHSYQVMHYIPNKEPIQCMELRWGYIFIGSYKGDLLRLNLRTKLIEDTINISESSSVLQLQAAQEGARRILLVATRKCPVTVRDAMNGLLLRTMNSMLNPTVYTLLCHRSFVYCGTAQHDVLIYGFQDGQLVHKLEESNGSGVVCLMKYKNLLFMGCYNGNIYMYKLPSHEYLGLVAGPGGLLLSMDIINDKIVVSTRANFKSIDIPEDILSHGS